MISRIEAFRYRCLRKIWQELGSFQVLVGPNASGKSTFLDVVHLLGDLLKDGLISAIGSRSPNPQNLVWMEEGDSFEMAVELDIPEDRRARIKNNRNNKNGFERARYEVKIGLDDQRALAILGENLWLKRPEGPRFVQREFFPDPGDSKDPIVLPEGKHTPTGWKKVVTKKTGSDYFFSETTEWNNPFRLGPQKLALANLPEEEGRFPVATWVKRILMEGVHLLALKSDSMRRPAPPGSPVEFQPDGSNLPRVIESLRGKSPEGFDRWLDHVRTALPDLQTIDTVEREEDKHRYLRIHYRTGLKAPSWTVSDGTLRLLALTLLAYIEEPDRVFLIEEPENGIHPQAVETVFQSLSSARSCQILCASHSPVILSLAEPEQVLCFSRNQAGATDVVRGKEHPNLRDWKRGVDLGTLFATGVLG